MDKTYQPNAIEARWYAEWEQQGYFKPAGAGKPYTIMLPPPNVTGTLHMGHAFQHTLQDALLPGQPQAYENTDYGFHFQYTRQLDFKDMSRLLDVPKH